MSAETKLFGLSPEADQSLAGALMMLEGSLVTIAAIAWLFLRLAEEGDARQRLLERGLDARAVRRAVRYGRWREARRMTPRTIGDVVLRYPDPDAELAGVALVGELWKRRPPVPFTRQDKRWELRLPRPPVDRFEYQLQLTFPDGRTALTLDPAAPVRPLGDKSVVELPAYEQPRWVSTQVPEGSIRSLRLPSLRLRTAVQGLLWSPSGADPGEPLPLLVVRDGPVRGVLRSRPLPRRRDGEAADPGAAGDTAGACAPEQALLGLGPVLRRARRAAAPTLAEIAPAAPGARPIGMGASLGALSLLHAHRRHPGAFGGLFLQSGSFFRQRFDRPESDFPAFAGSRDSWARSSARRSGRIRSPSP